MSVESGSICREKANYNSEKEGGGAEWYRGSILASHPAAKGSNPGPAKIFSLLWLVCEHY